MNNWEKYAYISNEINLQNSFGKFIGNKGF